MVNGKDAIGQSMAIIEYLEETHPLPSIFPKDPLKRALSRMIAQMIGADIQPLQNLKVLKKVSDKTDEKTAYARQVITEGFHRVEAALARTAGKYSVGDDVSVADFYLVPQVYNASRYGVEMALFPTIVRITAACNELEPFKLAAPEAQPDAEPPK